MKNGAGQTRAAKPGGRKIGIAGATGSVGCVGHHVRGRKRGSEGREFGVGEMKELLLEGNAACTAGASWVAWWRVVKSQLANLRGFNAATACPAALARG